MTLEGFTFLTYDKVRSKIEENLETDPAKFALTNSDNDLPVGLVSTQIKYLQKSKKKLPAWYTARCIIPPLAYEQSSSESTANLKRFTGERCLDLSCGLGVDSFYFAKRFHSVSSIEQNPVLAEVVSYNFGLMGVKNIDVYCDTASNFIKNYAGPVFDLIYIDPSRRNDRGERTYDLKKQSPDVTQLLSKLLRIGRKILIKTSPLFDIAEAYRIFPSVSKVSVISVNNECKEVWIEIISEKQPPPNYEVGPAELEVICTRENDPDSTQKYYFNFPLEKLDFSIDEPIGKFLHEADVAFYKARCFVHLIKKHFSAYRGVINHETGFFFSDELLPSNFPGKRFHIVQSFLYKPKKLKSQLAKLDIKQANLVQRHFPFSMANIRKQVGIKEGGNDYLIFTLVGGKKYVILASPVIHKSDAH